MMTAVGARGAVRRCVKTGVLAAVAVVATLALSARPVAADPVSVCPDNLVLLPDALVPQGAQKDHNENGLVCAKYQDGKFVGGPDDTTDDIVL